MSKGGRETAGYQTIEPVHSAIPICIFAKPPVPGEVKTRLIPSLGAAGAAALASAMLQDVWHAVESHPGVRPVLATTRLGLFPVSVREPEIWLQGEGDLGERIERISVRGLGESAAVIAVGADTPAFSAAHVDAALIRLLSYDAVVGPSEDGGFYLLALRRCPNGLFGSLPWSTGETCRALEERLRAHDFSVANIATLFDVDTPADLSALSEYFASHPNRQSATREWWVESSCASAS